MAHEEIIMRPVAHIRSDFASKFGIPRQSGLVDSLTAEVVFTPEFRDPEALRGIEGYSYLWLLWNFSANADTPWSPTVRPPRLGGNVRMGVFATRSPNRPNPIGLSSVKLLAVVPTAHEGTILRIGGADLMDGTPILDIKPYVAYGDSHPDAAPGFTTSTARSVRVECPDNVLCQLPADKQDALLGVLAQDPRPSYQADEERVYGFGFAGREVHFSVKGDVLTVLDIQ